MASEEIRPGSAVPSGTLEDERRRAVEDIVSDEAMPIAERQARLEALAAEWDVPADPEIGEAAGDPLRVQLANALALLAQGGHRDAP